jgi:hypothetical protein
VEIDVKGIERIRMTCTLARRLSSFRPLGHAKERKPKMSIPKSTIFLPVVIIAIPSYPKKRPKNAAATRKCE